MIYKISACSKNIKGNINLVASKSESNRVLIIRALCRSNFQIFNLAQSEDTRVLQQLLKSGKEVFDVGAAGTAIRFLTAYLAIKPGKWVLTGSKRMQQRPLKILVDALNKLGARIKYLGKEGFPPIQIEGTELTSKEIGVAGNISSQYISALLMIAPVLKNGLIINLKGKILSKPYINLTLNIMHKFGIDYEWKGNKITVPFQKYTPQSYYVESDWTAASYWYELACFADKAEINLKGLRKNSFQGDAILPEIMENFGVSTKFIKNGIAIKKQSPPNFSNKNPFIFNFKNNPDLAQTFLTICAGLKIPCNVTGLDNLSIKETDRIKALQTEFKKIGVALIKDGDNYYLKHKESSNFYKDITFKTYEDHRMAMSLVPLVLIHDSIMVENPEVVKKSYPEYWKDMQSVGVTIYF